MAPCGEQVTLRSRIRAFSRLPVVRKTKNNLRTLRQLGPRAWRTATSSQRALPNLVIVGAQKAGTTQLYASMVQHPACFGGITKEVQYFSKQPHRSLAWYRSHFVLQRKLQAVRGICIEASPSYFPSPDALQRMHRVMPDARVVVLLRDPVARAFSHYQHYKTRQVEARPFAVAVDEILRERPAVVAGDWFRHACPELLYDYVARGYYALQLEELWRLYRPEQTLVLDSADLFDDTDQVTQQVFEFAGLRRYPVPPKKVYNRGHYRERIDPVVAERLREHYRPHDERLMRLLGRPLRWMREDAIPRREAG